MTCPRRITRWIVCVSGFLRDRSRITGMVRLWMDMHRHRDDSSETLLLNWSDDPREYAALIWAASRELAAYPSIHVCGYSWGGQTALNLCRQLDSRGVPVRSVVLCDAVYRHWWVPRRWTSMVPWKALWVPPNVEEVWWFRQRRNLPRGHDVLAESTKHTRVNEPVTLQMAHSYMDDAKEFHEQCHAAVGGMAA